MSKPLDKSPNVNPTESAIAIIGMSCFFPKSSDLKEYWKLLFQGEDAISVVPDTHWSVQDYFDADPKKPDHVYCKRGGFLPPIQFDPMEFGIPPAALEATDTSQLLALVAAKRALADAGYGDGRLFDRERTSVVLGVTGTQELVIPLSARLGHPVWRKALNAAGLPDDKTDEIIRTISDSYVSWQESSFPGLLGNVVAGRIASRLDLGGTNCVVDAACASSMGAIHLAVMELMSGRSDMVITGGVDTLNDIFMHMCFSKTQVLSASGDARPFSRNADGTVLGEGVGMLILKRLPDAEKDGDRIYAVIRGMGSSSDGKSQSIYAPRADGQVKALRNAYRIAGIEPATVDLLEAHGTGTKVGDRVEFQALSQVFADTGRNSARRALGSVKSMIGHTKAAAGAAGMIKVALSLYNKVLPPTLKAEEPDPGLNLNQSPFYLNTLSRPWLSRETCPRRAGVSAFGFGGSNFHAVLEEYQPVKPEVSWDGSIEIFAWSAATKAEIVEKPGKLKAAMDAGLSDNELVAAAAASRAGFSAAAAHRLLVVFDRREERPEGLSKRFARIIEMLSDRRIPEHVPPQLNLPDVYYGAPAGKGATTERKIAFVFPGQGSQYVGMGRDLVCLFPEAFSVLETANRKFPGPARLSDIIFPPPAATDSERQEQEALLRRTDIAQPAIGAINLALLNILRRFGLEPDATCGHSFGELTALCAAGWINPETLFSMAIARGQLMGAAADAGHSAGRPGAMLAVNAPLKEIEKLVDGLPSVVLANRNSPSQGVLSGAVDAIDAAEKKCIESGFKTRMLPVSAAFHSPLVQAAHAPFRQALAALKITPTRTPVYSNSTAEPFCTDLEALKDLIAAQIVRPVDFAGEIENLYRAGIRTFIEIGPKSVLTGLIQSILKEHDIQALSLDASAGKQSGLADLARTLCRLAAVGHPLSLNMWERPAADMPRPRMPVSVLGANFKPRKAEKAVTLPNREPYHPINNRQEYDRVEKPMSVKQEPMDKVKQADPVFLSNTFSLLQEGLRSIQALQASTAQAHQKFLETQAEAGRVLQKMMDSARRLTETSLGIPAAAETQPARSQAENPGLDHTAAWTDGSIKPEGLHRGPAVPAESRPEPASDRVADPQRPQANRKIRETLLAVVSELTGYPIEMLGLEMDIEADLGIDSIKRVEILSTLEERLPGLPPVSPELMGRLKTLAQIVAHFSADETKAPAGLPADPPRQTTDRHPEHNQTAGPQKDPAEIRDALLAVVSELTGYPIEMLGLEMDIEADLGIDSIKRVEILSTLEERLPGLPPVSPELMGRLKTLAQIMAHFNKDMRTPAETPEPAAAVLQAQLPSSGCAAAPTPDRPAVDTAAVQKQVVRVVESAPGVHPKMTLAPDRSVFISGDPAGLAAAILREFQSRNIPAVIIPRGEYQQPPLRPKAAGLIIVADPDTDMTPPEITDAFFLAQSLAADLLESAETGGAFFASITRLDGAFGFNAKGVTTPLQGSLAGLVKTAAIEWKGVHCRALDIDPQWQRNDDIAAAVAAELLVAGASGPVEIGLGAQRRCRLTLCPAPYPEKPDRTVDLAPGDVVVISGGARGITAVAADALARQAKPTLVLLGRSPFPSPEPEWLMGESAEAAIKSAIIRYEFNGRIPSPVQLEKAYQKHMANREIAGTLAGLKSSAAAVHYYAVDIRERERLLELFEQIRSSCGPVKAVIHGAGVLEDRLISAKTRRQFSRVFSTKVQGLQNILEAVKGEPLKYLVLFSSVAARMGNRGQADYAMANEALNKIARQQSAARPDCRIVSINWGPWDGGMVSPSLKREFARNNIQLIPPESGARCLLYEMAGGADSAVEMVIAAELNPPVQQPCAVADTLPETPCPTPQPAGLALTLKREIDVENLPILTSHVLDGKPVVPFALMAEWFCQGALHENPGLSLLGIDDMRLMKGIRLDQQKRLIRLFAGKARKDHSVYAVDVELRDGVKDHVDVIHSKATAILAESFSAPPLYTIPAGLSAKNYVRTREEIYQKILFHGDGLHGIHEIVSCSPQGMLARISTAPPPEQWMKEPFRSRWLADPLVLDCAFQMAIVWCFEEKGFASLPSYYARYRQYRKSFPAGAVTVVLEVTAASDHKMKGNFSFLDADGVVIAQLHGYEAVMDVSLFKAFKPQLAANA